MGTGGFNWFPQWLDAAECIEKHLDAGPGFDLRMSLVETGDLESSEITAWLDKNPELWDPPSPPSSYANEINE
jgi:hypothetical protein